MEAHSATGDPLGGLRCHCPRDAKGNNRWHRPQKEGGAGWEGGPGFHRKCRGLRGVLNPIATAGSSAACVTPSARHARDTPKRLLLLLVLTQVEEGDLVCVGAGGQHTEVLAETLLGDVLLGEVTQVALGHLSDGSVVLGDQRRSHSDLGGVVSDDDCTNKA